MVKRRRFLVVSGFLGAGKTTTMIALADSLERRGVKAAIIANDLGAANLVDGMYTAQNARCSGTIADGCICYKTETLVDMIKRFADVDGAGLVMSDIPGCGVGALEHVYFKLDREYHSDFELAPFTVVCDPMRLRAIMPPGENILLPPEMNYLFRTQLKEADLIVLNKIDTLLPGESGRYEDFLKNAYPGVPVFAVSAKTGAGIDALADYLLANSARLVDVDTGYGGSEFIAAESKLSWYDRRVFIKGECDFDGCDFVAAFMTAVSDKLRERGKNVPHLKVYAAGQGDDFAKASLIGVDCEIQFDRRLHARYDKYSVTVNARAACESETLYELMDVSLRETAAIFKVSCHVFSTECFGMTDEGR